jgi:hypothetical protein
MQSTPPIHDFKNGLDIEEALLRLNELITEDLPGPSYFVEAIRNWRQFFFLSISSIEENEFPPLTKCWNELYERYKESFSDECFVAGCILADFQFGNENLSFAERIQDQKILADGLQPVMDFAAQIAHSRLGVYQIVEVKGEFLTLKEFFTDNVISVFQTLEEPEKGQVCLARVLCNGDHSFLFGDSHCWPSENHSHIFNMLIDKIAFYCLETPYKNRQSILPSQYERFMKMSGPYWMSIVGETDYFADVLMPDFYEDINEDFR